VSEADWFLARVDARNVRRRAHLLALAAAIRHSWRIDAPVKRSLTAFGN
jgi:hypothetical protein